MEVEAFSQINEEIYFPSTLSFIDSYNSIDILPILEEAGLTTVSTKLTFSLEKAPEIKSSVSEKYRIISYSGSSQEKRSYWSLWSQTPYYPEISFREGKDWELDLDCNFTRNPKYVQFAWHDGNIAGFTHWLPNIYKIDYLRKKKRGSDWLLEKSKEIGGGKIFKIAVYPNYAREKLLRDLCANSIEAMKSFGLTKFQIGNVFAHDERLIEIIERMKGKKAQEIKIMQKRINR
jgi:hypothetical protein